MTHIGVQCDEDYFSGAFRNLCSMFKLMGFILRRCINMAKITVRHKMFNVRRGSFRTNVQSNSFHYIAINKLKCFDSLVLVLNDSKWQYVWNIHEILDFQLT